MPYRQVELLRVYAWGNYVGAIARTASRRGYVFEYDPSWVRRGLELAPQLMPVAGRRQQYAFDTLSAETFYGLPPLLADSVPDRFGNSLIGAALAREGVQPGQVSALDRLAYVGARGMGALTYEPDNTPIHRPTVVLAEIVEAARAAIRGDLTDQDVRTDAMNQLMTVGTSAGGARAKAVLAWNRTTNEMRAGGIGAPEGFEQWLLKFDGMGVDQQLGDTQDYGRTEYAYYLMAGASGVTMSESRLLHEGGRAHFMTKRFDRPGAETRLHMQSLCALGALDFNEIGVHEYASLLLMVDALRPSDLEEAFRRIVLNVLAFNHDDHTKNFSFLMTEDGNWSLSPAYDVTFAYDPSNRWTAKHLMGVDGRFEGITRADLLRLADRFAVPGAREVVDQVAAAVGRWGEFADEAGLSAARTAEVGTHLWTSSPA